MSTKKVSVKDRTFNVTARIVIISDVEVEASSFEEAVEKSKSLKETDFVTVDGEYNDGSIRIVSVSKPGAWSTDDY